jgi:serine/threonine-protein kinase
MIELGQTVGNYRITAKLGEGGMGAVYLAEHPVLGRKAALKIIHPRHARSADVVARFVAEATAVSRIRHEHIVDVTDLGHTPDGDLYFVMEYLEGRTLTQAIAREAPMPPAHALTICSQIADALAAAHAHGVVHRDVKPDNVVLVHRGAEAAFVKVLDFGLAELANGTAQGNADADAARAARGGRVLGTPHYMSPEQCRNDPDVGPRSDVYALGVVLFEMLTGTRPFVGNGSRDVMLKQVSMRPPAARSLVPGLPESLDAVLRRALAKPPAERYGTMAAFRDVLLACAGRHVPARLAPTAAPTWRADLARAWADLRFATTLGHGAAALEHVDSERLHRPARRRGGAAAALVGAAALAGTLLAAGLTRGDAARASAEAPRSAVSTSAPVAPRAQTLLVTFGNAPDAGAVPDAGAATPLRATLETRFQELR